MRRSNIYLLGFTLLAFFANPILAQRYPGPLSAQASTTDRSATPRLKKLQVPGDQVRSLATKLSLRYRDLPDVRISPDTRNQQLIVLAPESAQSKIAADVQVLLKTANSGSAETSSATPDGPLRARLNNITWREFEDDLRRVTGDAVPVTTSRNGERASFHLTAAPLQNTTVEVDRRNNLITVVAPKTSLLAWQRLIAAVDHGPRTPNETTRWMRIENAEPAPIQQALRLLRNLRPVANTHPAQPSSPFRTAVFQQPPAAPGDAGAPPAGDEGEPAGGSGVIGETQIEFVPELGQIIIRGAKRDVERVMEVITQIEEKAKLTQPEVEVYPLKHADANAVADLLTQLYEDVLSARQGEVSITSLDAPNALLLIGRQEAIDGLKELIEKIDQPIDNQSGLRVFRLQHTSAIDAETAIRDFFTDRPGSSDDPRPGLGPRVRVLADYRTNSLVVSAAPRDLAEVTRLIDELDVEQVSSQSEIKVFPLNNAIAEDLAPILQEAISGETDDGGSDNVTSPSTSLQIVKLDSGDNQVLESGILATATVTADSGANALVVRAPSASMPLIAELIRQLDQSPGVDSLVKVFTIENGDASQLTQALVDLFGEDAATLGTAVGAGNLAGLPPSTAAAESSLVPLRFSTDIRTNSIVASGSAEDLEVVESILLRLDSEGFAERITEVIWLRNNEAQVIADAVTNYVNTRVTGINSIQQFQQGLGPYDLVDRDIIAVPEINSNSLLISVSPRLYPDVRRLIDQLDRRRPMVMIKVILAEVALDDTFEIGGEVGLQDSLQYDRGIVNAALPPSDPGFNFNDAGVPNVNSFDPSTLATTGVSSFGVGTTNPNLGYGGFVLNAASDSISLLLRTLQDARRLQILSRPHVMTLDNRPAFVQVGRNIQRVTGVINNGVTGSQVVTEPLDVGLILQVTPRVGADGLIQMEIDATRSDRDSSNGTFIPTQDGSVFVEDILITTAQSTVSAMNGQTVVYGGLIQKTRSNFSRRVPYVSDIPLLGYFFKYDQEFERRSELLVVLTPLIVTGEQDLEYVKQTESGRMSWCLADVVEMHGDVGLSGGYGLWGPAVGNTIYPDLQPTVDRINGARIVDEQVLYDQAAGGHAATTIDSPVMVEAAVGQPPATMQPQSTYSQPPAPNATPPTGVPGIESSIMQSQPTPIPQSSALPTGNPIWGPGTNGQLAPATLPPGTAVPSTPGSPAVPGHTVPHRTIPSPSDGASKRGGTSVRQTSFGLPNLADETVNRQVLWNQQIGNNDEGSEPDVELATTKSPAPRRIGINPAAGGKPALKPTPLGGFGMTHEASSEPTPDHPTISPRSWIR